MGEDTRIVSLHPTERFTPSLFALQDIVIGWPGAVVVADEVKDVMGCESVPTEINTSCLAEVIFWLEASLGVRLAEIFFAPPLMFVTKSVRESLVASVEESGVSQEKILPFCCVIFIPFVHGILKE